MTQEIPSHIRPFNNDRMGYMMAFRPANQEVRPRQAAVEAVTSAAPLLESQSPHPTQLTERQADMALNAVQAEAQTNGNAILQAHNGLDAQRVARLLELLG